MNNYMYILEGETEQKIVNALKEAGLIISGKVKVLNVLTKNVASIARSIKPSTNLVLVFDIDVLKNNSGVTISSHFTKNLKLLEKTKNVKNIYIIQQVDTLEDELVRATTIREIKELLNSQSNTNAKSDINKCTNLYTKLEEKGFNIEKLWIKEGFLGISQDSEKIKIK